MVTLDKLELSLYPNFELILTQNLSLYDLGGSMNSIYIEKADSSGLDNLSTAFSADALLYHV